MTGLLRIFYIAASDVCSKQEYNR